ncbi:MAG: hypothetical protein MUF21_12590 [Gemmatimonadaceae bacterium]|jgi:hypothetical protein|nr:hypothetical protein [Gemmatimonadaceae bacterium]
MHPLVWLGVAFLVLWGVLWLGLKIVSGVVHLLIIVGLALIVWGLVRRGARAVSNRIHGS